MKPLSIEDKLAVNKYDVDRKVHIKVKEDICTACENHRCFYICPADCYKLREGHITFSHEGCLECGSCRIACDKRAVEWAMPRGGFGLCLEYG
jgi:ferredoxin like protein